MPEHLAQSVYGHLERVPSSRGRLFAPERVDQPLARDGLVAMEQQEREEGSLPGPAKRERIAVPPHFERAEDVEPELFPWAATSAKRHKRAVSGL